VNTKLAAGVSLFLLIFVGLWMSPAASGQAASGKAFGTVVDQQGGVVPQAKVTVTNEATNVSKAAETNDDGYFEVLDLPIGSYAIMIEHEGFERYVSTSNRLLINQSLKFAIILKVGTVNQTITVESQATQVETVNPTIGQSITSRPIVDLPLNGRNVLDLAELQPGVTITDPDNGGAGTVNIAGGRSDSVTFLLDGGMNNEIVGNGVVYNPNPDTVQEFRILESNYTAEYGRNGGGIISVVLKSGQNSFHGSAFDYARNTDFDANSYFNKLDGLPVNDLKRHQYGGTISGPITIPHVVHGRDRLFFFFGYQGQHQTESAVAAATPTFTPAELGGDFSQAVNGGPDPNVAAFLEANSYFAAPNGNAALAIIDPTKINSVSANYIKLGLIPTSTTGLISTAETGTSNANEYTGKVDLNVTPKDKISVSVGGQRNPTFTPFVHADVPGFPEIGTNNNYYGGFTYTRTFSPNLLNELHFTAQRNYFTRDLPSGTYPTPTQLGFGVTPDLVVGPPDLDFDNGLTLGLSVQGPTSFASNAYGETDTVTWVRGRNTWKFGGGFTDVQNNTLFDYYGNGDFSFSAGAGVGSGNSFADFLLGIPSFYFQGPNAPNNIRTKESYAFGQDEWRVRSNLTLTLGLRYEYSTPKLDTEGRTFSIIPGFQSARFINAPVGLAFPGDPGAPSSLNFPDKDNFGPRFGFALDPWNNGKTSIRGGFGIFYDVLKGEDNLQFNGAPPFFSEVSANGGAPYPTVSQTAANGTCCPVPYFPDPWLIAGEGGVAPGVNPFPSTPPTPGIDFVSAGFLPWNSSGSVYLVNPHLYTPYTYQYNLDIQHEVAAKLMAEINYVGSSSRGLTGLVDINPFVLGTLNRVLNNMPQTNAEINNLCTFFDPGDCPYEEQPEFENIGFASYNSLEASLTRQMAESKFFGTTYFTLAYTYSHNIDNSSGFENRTSQVPAYAINEFRGNSDFDVRHRIAFSGGWDLPFDRAWSSGPKLLTKGWSLYPIFSWQTGFPLSIGANYAGGFAAPDDPGPGADGDPFLVRALFAQNVTSLQIQDPKTSILNTTSDGCAVPGTCRFYFDPNAFSGFSPSGGGGTPQYDPSTPCNQQAITNELPSSNCAVSTPSLRTFGLPRNFFIGPGRTNLDLALAKAFEFNENLKLTLRLEAFNVFNHAEFSNPDVSIASPTFGQITSTFDPRILQISARFTF
jgi:hypothetical protein